MRSDAHWHFLLTRVGKENDHGVAVAVLERGANQLQLSRSKVVQ